MDSICKKDITRRFFECYEKLTHVEIADKFIVTRQSVDQWNKLERPVPREKLKILADEQSISWDWLIDGYGEKERKHILPAEVPASHAFDTVAINARFLSCFKGMTKKELSERFGVSRHFIHAWFMDRKPVPWETLRYAVLHENVTWEWLIEGRDPKFREA